jgi:hypothetical protein
MLALRNKQMMVLLIVLVSFILALAVSTAIIQATNPSFLPHLWQQTMGNYYGG